MLDKISIIGELMNNESDGLIIGGRAFYKGIKISTDVSDDVFKMLQSAEENGWFKMHSHNYAEFLRSRGIAIEEVKAEEIVEEVKAEEIVEEVKTEEIVEEVKTEEIVEEVKTEEIVEEVKTEEIVEEVKTEEIVEKKTRRGQKSKKNEKEGE